MASASVLASPVEEALRHNAIPALRRLSIEENNDGVVITGAVSSYYLKQLAQEAVLPLVGQRQLHNRVSVVRER
jgi:hypothetical protein